MRKAGSIRTALPAFQPFEHANLGCIMKKWLSSAGGFLVGVINALLGAGGGMVAVPILRKNELTQAQAQASSVAVIFPLSLISAVLYLMQGHMTFPDALPYLPWGALGALAGGLLLSKIPDKWLKRIFGAFMIWAGIRMMMRS